MHIIKYTVLFCLLAWQTVSAQTTINLSAPLTGTQTEIARDAIIMNPGFNYSATGANTYIAMIDKTVVGTQTYAGITTVEQDNTQGLDTTRTLDKSLQVGSVAGSLDVSASGSATYQVPISVPQGIMGMQPSVSLVYNSQVGDGIMGMGWNLSCMSAISRSGKDMYHDNIVSGVLLTADDPLTLDGMRLLSKDAGYIGLGGTNFVTEVANNTIITKQSGGGFIVNTPDGKILEYGTTDNSRFDVTGGSGQQTVSWLLEKVTDANGNYMTYTYHKNVSNGEIYISAINYTGNSSLSPTNTVQFLYMNRTDPWTGGLLDKKISRTVLLEKIELYSDNNLLGSYGLKYNKDNGISQLTEVTQTNKDGQSLNASLFKWSKPLSNPAQVDIQRVISDVTLYNNDENVDQFFHGDFNGDGYEDMVIYRKTRLHSRYDMVMQPNDNNQTTSYSYSLLFKKGGPNGLEDTPAVVSLPRCKLFSQFLDDVTNGQYSYNQENAETMLDPLKNYLKDIFLVKSGDFDGDGQLEICVGVKNLSIDNTNNQSVQFWDYLANHNDGGTFNPQYTVSNCSYYFYKVNQSDNSIYPINSDTDNDNDLIPSITSNLQMNDASIDFNQDGKLDFKRVPNFYNSLDSAYFYNADINAGSFVLEQATDNGKNIYIEEDQAAPIDYNGDGLVDYAEFNGSNIYTKNINGTFTATYGNCTSTFGGCGFAGVTDINNDGQSEIIKVKPNWATGICNHKFVFNKYGVLIFPFPATGIYKWDPIPNDTANLKLTWVDSYDIDIVSNGSFVPNKHYNIQTARPIIRSVDVNGDGFQDLLWIETPNNKCGDCFTLTKILINDKHNGYIEQVLTTPIALAYNFQVGDFDGDGNVEIVSNNDRFIFNKGMPGYHITEITDGLNNQTKITYKPLTDASVFEKEASSNPGYPLISIKEPIYVVSKVKNSTALIDANQHPIWDSIQYQYKNLLVHLKGRGLLGFEKFITTSTTNNLQQIQTFEVSAPFYTMALKKTEIKTLNGTLLASTENTNNYESAQTNSLLVGLQFRPYVSHTVQTDVLKDVTATSDFVYNTVGNPTQSTIQYGTDASVVTNITYTPIGTTGIFYKEASSSTTKTYTNQPAFEQQQTFTYDNKGNLHTKVDFANTDSPVTSTYNYNNFGEVLNTVQSATGVANISNSVGYDSKGRPITAINPLGQTATTEYDNITGNVVKKIDVLGNVISYSYDNWGQPLTTTSPTGASATNTSSWVSAGDSYAPAQAVYMKTQSASGKATAIIYYDARGRELRTRSYNAFNSVVAIDKAYDSKGRVKAESAPYFYPSEVATALWTYYTYDDYGRQSTIVSPTSSATINYNGLTVTSTVNGRTTSKTVNALGNVITAVDAGGNSVSTIYHSSGQPKQITAAGATTSMTYDAKGQQLSLTDADAGLTTYSYDALGRLKTQTDARGNIYTMTYDNSGRISAKSSTTGDNYTYTYLPNGLPYQVIGGTSTRQYAYDEYGRVLSQTDILNGNEPEPYTTAFQYDYVNRVTQKTYPSGYVNKYDYSSYNGELTKIFKTDGTSLIWQLTAKNSKEQVTQFNWGNNIQTNNTYSPNGFITQQTTGSIYNMRYTFDEAKGNLMYRYDTKTGQQESFNYDALDRLEVIYPDADDDQLITYSANGNILAKYDAGTYQYNDATHPHAVTGVTGNITIPSFTQQITYNAFGKVATITEDINSLNISYNTDQQRIEGKWYSNGTLVKTKKYIGDYEKLIQGSTVKEYHYIYSPTGLTAVMIRTGGTDNLYYICTDHLGSITALVNENGTLAERHSYDAWGRERDPNNWSSYTVTAGLLDRGYTGHEHLREFGLINMNGRVYDPILGRMLSPDNYVQDPFNSQNYNRYGYCVNNPLKFTDPNGQFFFLIPIIVGALVGAYTGASLESHTAAFWNWDKNAWKGAIIGGILGGAGGALVDVLAAASSSTAVTGMLVAGKSTLGWAMTSNAFVTGAINMGVTTLTSSGNIDAVWKSGVTGLLSGALSGGLNVAFPKNQLGFWGGLEVGGVIGATSYGLDGYLKGKRGWDLLGYMGEGALITGISTGLSDGFFSRIKGNSFFTGKDYEIVNGCKVPLGLKPLNINFDFAPKLKLGFSVERDGEYTSAYSFGFDFHQDKWWQSPYYLNDLPSHPIAEPKLSGEDWNFPLFFRLILRK